MSDLWQLNNHHKDNLHFSSGIVRDGEFFIIFNSIILNGFTQIVNVPIVVEFQVGFLTLFSHFSVSWIVLDRNSLQCNDNVMSNAGVCQDTILGLSINDLPDDFANCNIAICNQDINHSSKCDLAFDLWQQLENAREIEFRP